MMVFMTLTEIATREQTVRGSLKAKRAARVINAKEAEQLDRGIATDLEELADLRQHANAAFEAAASAGLPEPPSAALQSAAELASGEGDPPPETTSPDVPSYTPASYDGFRLGVVHAAPNGIAAVKPWPDQPGG